MKREKAYSVAQSQITELKPYLETPSTNSIYNLSNNIVSLNDTVELDNITEDVLLSALLSVEPETYFRDQGYSAECLPDGRSLNQRLPMERQGRENPWKESCKFSSPSAECGGA